MGGKCTEIDYFPNATVAEYGMIEPDENVVNKIKTELFVRGPVAATINGTFWFSAEEHAFLGFDCEAECSKILTELRWTISYSRTYCRLQGRSLYG